MFEFQFHVHNHSADGNTPDADHIQVKKRFFPSYGTVVTSSDENKTGGNNSHNGNAAPHQSASLVVLGLQVLFAFIELVVEFHHGNYPMVVMNASMVFTGLLSLFAHWKSKQDKSSNSSHQFNPPPENRDDGSDESEYDPAAIATSDFSENDIVACLVDEEERDVESTATTPAAIATTSRSNADDEITKRKQIHCCTLCVWVVSMCVFEVLIGPCVERFFLDHVVGRCKNLFAMTPQHKELGEKLCSRGELVPAKIIGYALGLVLVSLAIFNLYRFYAEAAEAAEAAALAENVHVGTVTAIYITDLEDVELCHSESKRPEWISEQSESGWVEVDPEPKLVACSNCIELTEQQHLL
mmetsp:Transcript_13874/g.31042  ORF Transcript_13874/g.31042 Transcript_13874/m.31042 type:complete len:355 (+) Transcript_13874:463-1527(+)